MPKITYEIDPHNRLVAKRSGKLSGIARFRTCFDGTFKADGKNSLIFNTKVSDKNSAQQMKFKGIWSLDNDHNLVFTLNKWGQQIAGNKLTFAGEIVDLTGNEFVFSLETKQGESDYEIYFLRLGGRLALDNQNKLTFAVERGKDPDIIKFSGSWQVKNNQLVYEYEKRNSSQKKDMQRIMIKGYWDIKEKYRLSYILDNKFNELQFRVSVGEFIRKGNRYGLKYDVGAGFGSSRETKEIIIFGKWELKNGVGLVFEIEYEDGERNQINFNAKIALAQNYTFSIGLKDLQREDLGISLKLSRKIPGAGEGFVRFLSQKDEKAVEIGAGFRW